MLAIVVCEKTDFSSPAKVNEFRVLLNHFVEEISSTSLLGALSEPWYTKDVVCHFIALATHGLIPR